MHLHAMLATLLQAVSWNAWASFVSSSVLSCACAPLVGRASDQLGRKPFILVGVTLGLAPMLVLAAHVRGLVPIQWYYPVSALNGAVSSFSMALLALADSLAQVGGGRGGQASRA
jgi:MFS family permease